MTAANGALAVVAQKSCPPRRSGNKARPTLPFYLIVGAFLERSFLQSGKHGVDVLMVDRDTAVGNKLVLDVRIKPLLRLSRLGPNENEGRCHTRPRPPRPKLERDLG